MSTVIHDIFTGTHPRLVNHLGGTTGLDKPASGQDQQAGARFATQLDQAKISPEAKAALSPIDAKDLNGLQPQLSKQAPVSSMEMTQRLEIATQTNIVTSGQVQPKAQTVKVKRAVVVPEQKKDDGRDDENIRSVGYYITVKEDRTSQSNRLQNALPAPANTANGYNSPQARLGKLVNIII